MCVCVYERERECVCMCVCERVCDCVCVYLDASIYVGPTLNLDSSFQNINALHSFGFPLSISVSGLYFSPSLFFVPLISSISLLRNRKGNVCGTGGGRSHPSAQSSEEMDRRVIFLLPV